MADLHHGRLWPNTCVPHDAISLTGRKGPYMRTRGDEGRPHLQDEDASCRRRTLAPQDEGASGRRTLAHKDEDEQLTKGGRTSAWGTRRSGRPHPEVRGQSPSLEGRGRHVATYPHVEISCLPRRNMAFLRAQRGEKIHARPEHVGIVRGGLGGAADHARPRGP